MLVAALFRHDGVPQDPRHLPVHRPPLEIAEPHALRRQHRHIAIGQKKHVARVTQNGGDVGGHEVFVIAQPDHHGRSIARRHNLIRVRPRDEHQGEHAREFLDGGAHGFFQVAAEMLLHQVRDDLGIGLGFENVPFGFQLVLQRQVVFHDAVMHHHDVALAVAMRVRVLFGGPSVRSPSRVPDSVAAIHRNHADGVFQVAQFALGAAHRQLLVVTIDGDAGGVVSPVFQPLQALQNNRHGLVPADIAHDSAHLIIIGAVNCVHHGVTKNTE